MVFPIFWPKANGNVAREHEKLSAYTYNADKKYLMS